MSDLSARSFWWHKGFVALLLIYPLALGGNRPWASDFFALLLTLPLLGMAFARVNERAQPLPRAALRVASLLFTLALVWTIVQILPLTPKGWHHPLWQETQSLTGGTYSAISLDPSLFPEAFLRLLSYAACFFLALYGARQRQGATFFLKAFTLASALYAFYGLASPSYILWIPKEAYLGDVSSTFVNKNSYATFAGLGLLGALALVAKRLKELSDPATGKGGGKVFLAKILAFHLPDVATGFAPLVIAAALVLSGSRAGVASSFLGVLVLGAGMKRRRAGKHWGGFLLPALVFFGVFLALSGQVLGLHNAANPLGDEAGTRLAAYEISARAIKANPWLGYGLGSFENVFRLERDSSFSLWFQHAHSDPLETMIELGVPAACSLFLALAILAGCCLRGVLTRRRDVLFPAWGLAAFCLVAAHSLVDFSLQIPALAASLAAILGTGVAQSLPSSKAPRLQGAAPLL